MTWGHLQNVSNGAAIILGTGVGVGLCINGQLYKGSHYQAGEVSFMIRRPAHYRSKFICWRWIVGGSADPKLSETLQVANDGPIVFQTLTDS